MPYRDLVPALQSGSFLRAGGSTLRGDVQEADMRSVQEYVAKKQDWLVFVPENPCVMRRFGPCFSENLRVFR